MEHLNIRKKLKTKGISTFIAALLMMVLAIAAGVMIYAYTMGYLGGATVQPQMKSMQVQSIAEQNDELWLYLKNTGQGTIVLDDPATGVSIYVNDKLWDYASTHPFEKTSIDEGETVKLAIPLDSAYFTQGLTNKIKIVSVDGTFTETSTKITSTSAYSLTTSVSPSGGGTVTRDDSGPYELNDPVQLTAVNNFGYTFDHWEPTALGTNPITTVTITGHMTATAVFTPNQYTLTVTPVPTECSVTKSPNQATYAYGSNVQLTPVAASGYTFTSWSGDLTGSANPVTITIDGDMAITATFTASAASPTVSIAPTTWAMNVGQSHDFVATALGGSGTYSSYHWYVDSAVQGETGSTFSYAPAANGVYSITVTVTDNLGSTSALSPAATVTVSTTLAASVTPTGPLTMDIGQTQLFTATASGGSGTYSYYQWYVDSAAQGGETASTFSYAPAAAGSHSITVTVTDSLSATSAQSTAVSVTVSAAPTVSIAPTGPLTMDISQTQLFTATASGGTGTLSYQWYLGGSTAVGTDSSSYSFSQTTADLYSVTCKVTDSASTPVTSPASNGVSVTVSKVTPTIATLLSDSSITLGGSVTDTVTLTGVGGSFPDPTGTVAFYWSTDHTNWHLYDTKTLPDDESILFPPSSAVTHWFKASYSGDDNYVGVESGETDEPLTVTQLTVTLSVTIAGTGTGKVNDGSVDHTATYTKTYNYGDSVTLTPTADASSTFTSWAGAGTGSPVRAITMNGDQAVTATFTANSITITLRPYASGDSTSLTRQGDSANYLCVDETTIGGDGTTTYVYSNNDGSFRTDTYNIPNPTLSGSITNVRIYITCNRDSTGQSSVSERTAIRIGSGNTEYGTTNDLTTSWTNYYSDYATKSGNLGSGAWTWADITNLQIGASLRSQQSGSYPWPWNYAQCTQVWVEITYTPS